MFKLSERTFYNDFSKKNYRINIYDRTIGNDLLNDCCCLNHSLLQDLLKGMRCDNCLKHVTNFSH